MTNETLKVKHREDIQEGKEGEKQFTLAMTPTQRTDLIRMINYELSEPLGPEHGNRLNDLFRKLTGKNHDNWQ